jgi:hypothetical protein
LNNLLTFAIEAHGGLDAWNKLQTLRANVFHWKCTLGSEGGPRLIQKHSGRVKLHSQEVATHLVDVDERIVFTPKQMHLESEAGRSNASTRGQPLSASPPISNGTNCTPDISAVTRSGVTSQRRSSTPTPALILERLPLGLKTESVGAYCRSPSLTDTWRTHVHNTRSSGRTALSEDISTRSMFWAALLERIMHSSIETSEGLPHFQLTVRSLREDLPR